jgi:DAK2 domain fusion protein YloV
MPLNADALKRVIAGFHDRLAKYREAINRLNVYPVPDGDTGTNMHLTLGSVVAEVESARTMAEVTDAISEASLLGARGNSGVILSQILRGLADTFRPVTEVGVEALVEALDRASTSAYRAVLRPVEGTMLTVLREAANAARTAGTTADEDLAGLLDRVYRRAVEALEHTPQLLPVLKQAGVVDAGGAGLLLLLHAFLEEVSETPAQLPEELFTAPADLSHLEALPVADLRYEVMFLLDAPEETMDIFKDSWVGLGDSIVVVGSEGSWNCHIHTDHIGSAIEAGIAAGRPSRIQVTDLREQVGAHRADLRPDFEPRPEVMQAPIGVVAVVVGGGLIEVFRDLGAQGIVSGGQSMNPATQEILSEVDATPASTVVVLPNNKNIVPVAEQVDALTSKQVLVVPTRSVPQGLAAMIAYHPAADDAERLIEDMAAAASSVVTGEITQAVRDAAVDAGPIRQGDWLGIADGTIVVIDPGQEGALRGLVASILPPGAELLTLYRGEGAETAAAKTLEAWLSDLHPTLKVQIVEGGQPLYPFLVSIE